MEKIGTLTRDWLADIHNDVGGAQLERAALTQKLDAALSGARLVQIRGLPGSGKSVLLRQKVEFELEKGPVLFLKSDRLEGKGWSSFANIQGLSSAPLINLLVEIAAVGSDTLFIDGIDRMPMPFAQTTANSAQQIFDQSWRCEQSQSRRPLRMQQPHLGQSDARGPFRP